MDEGGCTKDDGQRTTDKGRRTKDDGRRRMYEGRRIIGVIGWVLVLVLVPAMPVESVSAKSKAHKPQQETKAASPGVEQEQQFTYYWYAARQAIEEERYADAYALLQFCNAINPDDAQTNSFLGILYQGIGDEARAKEAFKKAYELAPDDCWQRYLEPLEQQYEEQKDWKNALKTLDEIEKRQGSYDAYNALRRYRIYAIWGKPKKAIAAIDRYLETEPTDIRFLLFKLELMERTHAKPKALYAMYERVLEVNPYNLTVLNNYAWLLVTQGDDLTKAERMSQMTIREEPNNSSFLDTYGWIMYLQGQHELAKFYLQKALRNATENNKEVIERHLMEIER